MHVDDTVALLALFITWRQVDQDIAPVVELRAVDLIEHAHSADDRMLTHIVPFQKDLRLGRCLADRTVEQAACREYVRYGSAAAHLISRRRVRSGMFLLTQ